MEINKQIHWFDLDGVLINTDAKWWIVDKLNPGKPLIKISQYDGALILSGFHRADNIFIQYNGHDGYMSKDMYLKIQKIKNIEPENLGFSWREFSDSKLIQNQASNLKINTIYIQHLKNSSEIINILTARGNKEAHILILNKLKDALEPLKVTLNDDIFVNDISQQNILGSSASRKSQHILQNIIGYKIEVDKFVPIKCDKFDTSYFYDDEDKNIEECCLINVLLSNLLEKTMPLLKDIIIKDIKIRKPKLYVNLVTTNETNLFQTKEIDIVTAS